MKTSYLYCLFNIEHWLVINEQHMLSEKLIGGFLGF